MLQSIMGYGYPPDVDRQMDGQTRVKILPSRRTTYGNNWGFFFSLNSVYSLKDPNRENPNNLVKPLKIFYSTLSLNLIAERTFSFFHNNRLDMDFNAFELLNEHVLLCVIVTEITRKSSCGKHTRRTARSITCPRGVPQSWPGDILHARTGVPSPARTGVPPSQDWGTSLPRV